MRDANPYQSPSVLPEGIAAACRPAVSLAIGFAIDGAGTLVALLSASHAGWLRLFLPFAAAHAVAAALIVYRTKSNGTAFSVGDHFFLRYGAVVMAGLTWLVRALMAFVS